MPLGQIDFQYWFLQTVAMMVTCFLIPKLTVKGPIGALFAVIALAFVNAHVWNAALFFQLPDSFTIRAITLIATNGFIFWIIVKLLPGIEIKGVFPALAAPIVFTICSILISKYGAQIEWDKVWDKTLELAAQIRSYFEDTKPLTTK